MELEIAFGDFRSRLVLLERSIDGFSKNFTENLQKLKREFANLDTAVIFYYYGIFRHALKLKLEKKMQSAWTRRNKFM